MKRVNLLEYFQLGQALANAKRALSPTLATKAGNIYFGVSSLENPLSAFGSSTDGFNACKHVAIALRQAIKGFGDAFIYDDAGEVDFVKLDTEVGPWVWSTISREVDAFIAVFTAECRDLEMYSVGQIGIYNMNSLVSKSSERFPEQFRPHMPPEAMTEFDNAGRCLAFNLPTACGFHSVRGLELCLLAYLGRRMENVEKLKSWNEYLQQIEKLVKDLPAPNKPSPKIAPMIQRMKDLDRNPLMHPRDTLDIAGADQLFNLAAITAVELAKDDAAMALALLPAPANEAGVLPMPATPSMASA